MYMYFSAHYLIIIKVHVDVEFRAVTSYRLTDHSLVPIQSRPRRKTVLPTESTFLAVELDFRITNQISVLRDTQVRR